MSDTRDKKKSIKVAYVKEMEDFLYLTSRKVNTHTHTHTLQLATKKCVCERERERGGSRRGDVRDII